MAITVEAQTVEDFFTNSNTQKLIIPLFQRPYLWGKEEIENFKEDLLTLVPFSTNNSSDLFLGLIVLCPFNDTPNQKEFQIIDGQQRITTFSILISIISDLLKDFLCHSEVISDSKLQSATSKRFYALQRCLTNNRSELLLETANESLYESDFLRIILTEITSQKDTSLIKNYDAQNSDAKNSFILKKDFLLNKKEFPNQKKAKEKNSLRNYDDLYNWLDKQITQKKSIPDKVNFLLELSSNFLSNVYVIPFLSKNEEKAFSLFETLNDRGLEVAAIDLIKNLCIMNVERNQREDVYQLWKQIFTEILNKKDGTVFLRYAFNSQFRFIRKNEIYKQFQREIKNVASRHGSAGVIDFLKNLISYAKNYDILKNKDQNYDESLSINNVIHLLKDTSSIQWITIGVVLLKLWDDFTDKKDRKVLEPKIEELFLKIHKIIFFITIKGLRFNIVEEFFPEIARKINEPQSLIDKISSIENAKMLIENKIISENLNLSITDLEKYSTYDNANSRLLLNYLRYKNLKNGNSFSAKMTLEHVYPQNPNNKEWADFNKYSDDEKLEFCSKIGNHLLLTDKLNKELQNKEFCIKKKKYSEKNCEDLVLDHNMSYNNLTVWDSSVINKRSELIYKQLKIHLGI